MPISDYAHWGEAASVVWYDEEGRHEDDPDYWYGTDPYDNYDDDRDPTDPDNQV